MRLAKKILSGDSDDASTPPFRLRLHAWWNGYNLNSVAADSDSSEDGSASAVDVAEAVKNTTNVLAAWHEPRRKLMQLVFGPGFVYPGGERLTTELFQALGLDSSSSMIEIGAGLGGSTRTIAKQSGAYVTAWELDQDLAWEATLQAEVHSLEKQAGVHTLDLGDYEFKPNFFNGALVHESLYQVEDKKALLKEVVDSIKVNSQIVIYDLFFEQSASSAAFVEWLQGEGTTLYPMGIDEARQCLSDLSIDIRVTDDDSDRYRAVALKAWAEFVGRVSDQPVGDELAIPMVREVERWARRTAAIDTGELRVYKITGIKRQSTG